MGANWGCPGALHTEGDLTGQLKLIWVQARVSQGAQCRKCPGWVTGAKAGAGRSAPDTIHRGCPGGMAKTDASTGKRFLGHSVQEAP